MAGFVLCQRGYTVKRKYIPAVNRHNTPPIRMFNHITQLTLQLITISHIAFWNKNDVNTKICKCGKSCCMAIALQLLSLIYISWTNLSYWQMYLIWYHIIITVALQIIYLSQIIMASWHGDNLRINGCFLGETTIQRSILSQRTSKAELCCFLYVVKLNKMLSTQSIYRWYQNNVDASYSQAVHHIQIIRITLSAAASLSLLNRQKYEWSYDSYYS